MNAQEPHERRVCGAKTRSGTPCRLAPRLNGRCRLHGGKTPGGIASPHFQTGRYSKYLPGRLLERYQQSVGDTELLNLRDDIALLDARLGDLISRVDTGESGQLWRALQAAWKAHQKALTSDPFHAPDLLADVGELISRGHLDVVAWVELESVLQDRRKLVESERKRLVEMQQSMSAEQAMVLLTAVVESVRQHVSDAPTLRAIAVDFGRLMGRPLPRGVGTVKAVRESA